MTSLLVGEQSCHMGAGMAASRIYPRLIHRIPRFPLGGTPARPTIGLCDVVLSTAELRAGQGFGLNAEGQEHGTDMREPHRGRTFLHSRPICLRLDFKLGAARTTGLQSNVAFCVA